MKISNLTIGIQLIIGLMMLTFFVIILGVVSFLHTQEIHEQMELIYKHPMQVRVAIEELQSDATLIHWALETALLQKTYEEMTPFIKTIKTCENRKQTNIQVLKDYYLGSQEDVIQLNEVMKHCRENRNQVFTMIQAGDFEKAEKINNHKGTVIGSAHMEEINALITKISDFAFEKADSMYAHSILHKKMLTTQLIIIMFAFILLAICIIFILLNNIRRPLIELTKTTKRFAGGDLSVRNAYESKNEIGVLSSSFNSMAENIELNSEINEKSAILAGKMLSEDEARKFFESTLQILIEHTSAQMSAVYLLNEQKTFFEHFVSIGITGEAKSAFSAKELEGEFGSAIAAKKIQHIKDIPKTTRFIFNAVNGAFIPHEIITVPIVSGKEVIAIISLANLRPFSAVSIQLIHKIYPTYCARVEGILAYRKMLEFSNRLEAQNQELESQKTELESQKTELEMQSVELSEQNRELESQKNQLQEASKLKTSFLANMSHELRTPLNSVIALSGVLNRKLINRIPSEEYSYIEVIERNGKHLLSLINDILDIARIESGREEIELSEFAICDCVNDVISMISPQIKEKEPQLKPVTGDCDVRITSDLTKVKHILQNLVGNAVKFTEKGEITISVKKIENEISVTVSDTGIGIASEHLAHIFDEFRQADGSASRKFGGTGLGLAIAKKYATLLRGKLTVKSREGVGSDFTLCLPVRLDEQNFSLEKEAYSLKSDFGKRNFQANQKTILLVEDSQPAIIQMKDFLEESGFEVIVAHNGREALQLVSYVIPDAIILDLMMPEIDGFEVLKNIRNAERTIGIPVLILTAKHITKEELQFLKRNNIYQLIQKGDVKREELQKAVAGMVASANVPPLEKEQKGLNEKPSILVIEDNPDNMISIKALLSDKYEVYEAFDGMEGIEKAKKEVPNLILMDIGLKNIDGIETFKRIRLLETLRHIPIVAITANALSENRKEILAHGFDGFIAKPINENDFFKTLKEILNGNDAL